MLLARRGQWVCTGCWSCESCGTWLTDRQLKVNLPLHWESQSTERVVYSALLCLKHVKHKPKSGNLSRYTQISVYNVGVTQCDQFCNVRLTQTSIRLFVQV